MLHGIACTEIGLIAKICGLPYDNNRTNWASRFTSTNASKCMQPCATFDIRHFKFFHHFWPNIKIPCSTTIMHTPNCEWIDMDIWGENLKNVILCQECGWLNGLCGWLSVSVSVYTYLTGFVRLNSSTHLFSIVKNKCAPERKNLYYLLRTTIRIQFWWLFHSSIQENQQNIWDFYIRNE